MINQNLLVFKLPFNTYFPTGEDGSGAELEELSASGDDNSNETDDEGSGNGRGRKNRKSAVRVDVRDAVTGNVAELLSASVLVTVGVKGIFAKISTQDLVAGVDKQIDLDASASFDKDNSIGDLLVPIYICLTSGGWGEGLICHPG
jgi:hypothetical protein